MTPEAACIVMFIFIFIASFVVALRFFAQSQQLRKCAADEYLIALALLSVFGLMIVNVYNACTGGLGLPLNQLSTQEAVIFRKLSFGSEFFYVSSVGIVKASILMYYKRIFINRGFVRAAYLMLVAVCAWMVAFFFSTLFQAMPVYGNWIATGHTIDLRAMLIVEAVTDIALDLLILCLPVFVIKRLNITFERKVMVTAIFGLGIFCVIASTVRLYYVTIFTGSEDSAAPSVVTELDLWSLIEPCASIICACLPTLSVLFRESHLTEDFITWFLDLFREPQGPRYRPRVPGRMSEKRGHIRNESLHAEWISNLSSNSSANHETRIESGGVMDNIITPPNVIQVHTTLNSKETRLSR